MEALTTAEAVEAKDWEKFPATGTAEKLQYFEGCLPSKRPPAAAATTLRFGPMKARRPHRSKDRPLALCRRPTPPGETSALTVTTW